MSENFLSTKPYKGTRDFYPEDMRLRNWFFGRMAQVARKFGYEEYGGPVVESFDLYAAKSGEEIVGEQIYHFEDKGNRRLAIRPEMTPTVARMVAAREKELPFPLRWFTIVNLMRYERPQKGRLREHWQLNVDLFGESGVRADLEILMVVVELLKAFGADPSMFELRLSNRLFFNEVLKEVLGVGDEEVVAVSKAVDKRAKISPEEYANWLKESGMTLEKIEALDRIFESTLEELLSQLPEGCPGGESLRELFQLLEETGLAHSCKFDFSIVRGFDYYTGTVFEVYDTSPENRRALFGGGRYDNLVGLFKKSAISGVGFGFGDVTFQHFLEIHDLIPADLHQKRQVYIAAFEDMPYSEYLALAAELREGGIPTLVALDPSAKMKKQMTFAERQACPLVLIMGGSEKEAGEVTLKNMNRRSQETLPREKLVERVRQILEEVD